MTVVNMRAFAEVGLNSANQPDREDLTRLAIEK